MLRDSRICDYSDGLLAAAIEVLESLQRSYDPPGEELKERADFIKFANEFADKMGLGDDFQSKVDAMQRDAESRMFSRYDNPAWFAVISHIVKQIEAIIAKMGPLKDDKKIIFGGRSFRIFKSPCEGDSPDVSCWRRVGQAEVFHGQ